MGTGLDERYPKENSKLADAILDRVLHAAHKLALAGESLRKQEKTKP
jgi:DNA replication protein DnaC